MMADNLLSQSQTPVKIDLKVPVGHIIANSKWRGTELINSLQSGVQILYEDHLGSIDFYPSDHLGVVYISEAELITSSSYRKKLAKLRKTNNVPIQVIAEKTPTSSQYYSAVQKFCMMELGFVLLPVPGQTEAGSLLAQMVHSESKQDTNPFCKKKKPPSLDAALLNTVQCIPKLGEVKAKLLLDNFHSLHGICKASVEELIPVVGKASAQHIKNFFGQSVT